MSARRRDLAIALGLAIAALALLVAARADGRDSRPADRSRPLPAGWHEVDRPLTGVILPVQVFAAATYPIVLHHRPAGCGPPRRVLAEMPPGGVLLQIIEYPPRDLAGRPIPVPRLPRRPAHFHWSDATWARFECAGPSYKFTYRQEGRALQAQVWLRPGTVDPTFRKGALNILDNWP